MMLTACRFTEVALSGTIVGNIRLKQLISVIVVNCLSDAVISLASCCIDTVNIAISPHHGHCEYKRCFAVSYFLIELLGDLHKLLKLYSTLTQKILCTNE